MKIALIGATGFVGSRTLTELLARGHHVTAFARKTNAISKHQNLETKSLDVYDEAAITKEVRGHDAVISAFNPGWNEPDLYELFMKGSTAIVNGVEAAGIKRLLIVGGAGSLFVAPGVQLIDTPEFKAHVPANIVPGALAARDHFDEVRKNKTLDWTFVSPPAFLVAGERSGKYRIGKDDLLMDGQQPAGISVEDLAVAIVDEIENPKFVRARFTAARS